jgi:hypothetical protein
LQVDAGPNKTADCETQTPKCLGCTKQLSGNRQLKNKIIDLEKDISNKDSKLVKLTFEFKF